jgi:RNA polymerase sigma-70 factor (ECF subfamily)
MSAPFRELFDSVGPALLRYLRRMLGSMSDAEEIVQDVFLKLHCRFQQEEPPLENPRAWLFRVATNAARDLDRERRVRAREAAHRPNPIVVDFELHVERRQLTRRVLLRLPRRMRQVLLLWSEGFSYREIAEITAIEPGYIGVLLQRARSAFKKEYEQLDSADSARTLDGLL